jgi:hypothetical protein
MMLFEKIDYELCEASGDEKFWNVRILAGKYAGTEFYYGNIKLSEGKLKYHVKIVESTIADLRTTDKQFQKHCGKILESIMIAEEEATE